MQDGPVKTYIYLGSAALVSLAVHLLLLGVAGRIPVHLFASEENEPPPSPYRAVIRIFQEPDITVPADGSGENSDATDGDAVAGAEDLVKKYFEETDLIIPPKPTLELAGLGSNIVLPDAPKPDLATQPSAPRPQILSMNDEGLGLDDLHRRFQIPDIPRTSSTVPHLPSLLADGPLNEGALPPLKVGMRLGTPKSSIDDVALPPLVAPKTTGSTDQIPDDMPPPDSLMPGLTPPGGEVYDPIDSLLTVKMSTYMPRGGDGYFRIDVSPNPRSSHLRAIPKDVLLLIDCSTSISPGKLKVFKEATEYALDFLNPRDRFNVVSFRTEPNPLFPDYTPVTRENIKTAKDHVRSLSRGGMTDVYAGLSPFLGSQSAANRAPLLVYILTDGKSTVRNKLENDEFLRKIVEVNRADVTIYSASAGKGANRFLLDLLSYSNRGLPLHREDFRGYDKVLAQFMGAHNDIIVADVKYDLTGGLASEIYPKRTPHLYRGDTLSIYGRYPRNLRQLGLRLTGKSADGRLQELVYQGDLSKATKTTSDLSYEWIGQKVFDLVIRNVLDPREEYAQEISRLKKKYNLQIPYF